MMLSSLSKLNIENLLFFVGCLVLFIISFLKYDQEAAKDISVIEFLECIILALSLLVSGVTRIAT